MFLKVESSFWINKNKIFVNELKWLDQKAIIKSFNYPKMIVWRIPYDP
jgi:hypothetical protein